MISPRRMRVLRDPRAVRRQIRAWRKEGMSIAFVPTMGFLHEGHLSLVRKARSLTDRVVASIFVNPTQFAPGEDLASYPQDIPRDLKLLRGENVDLCFTPDASEVYADDHRTEIHVTGFDTVLEGSSRPTHFAGVALVVAKLLHITEPDVLVLGQKDAQQAVVLETMVRDLDMAVRVVRGLTVRESNGLALSSRNAYLDSEQRAAAASLWRSLRKARQAARSGERSAARIKQLVRREIGKEPGVRLEYTAVVNARNLEEIKKLEGRVLIPIAAYVGKTRLIDNVEFEVPS
jgi:pantoate--beta-alanine ligase